MNQNINVSINHDKTRVLLTLTVKNRKGEEVSISPTAYLDKENTMFLSRILAEHAEMIPREMVEGDLGIYIHDYMSA